MGRPRPYRIITTYADGVMSSHPCNSIEDAIVKGAKMLRETRSTGRGAALSLIAVEVVPDTDPNSPPANRRVYTLAEGITDDILAEADDTWVRSPKPDQHALRAALAAAGVIA